MFISLATQKKEIIEEETTEIIVCPETLYAEYGT